MGSTTNTTVDGLPILGKHVDEDTSDLPIIKKKDTPGAGPTPSPSDSSPKPAPTEPPVGTSASDSKTVTANYKAGTLTSKDIDDKPLGFQVGPSAEELSAGINNKTKNLNRWSNAPGDAYVTSLVNQHQQAQKQLEDFDSETASAYGAGSYKVLEDPTWQSKRKAQRDKIVASEQYFRGQIQKEYDEKKKKLVPELTNILKGGMDIDAEYDPFTHTLTPIAAQQVLRRVDAVMNDRNDATVNAAVSGDVDKKERVYEDLGKSVIDQLNLLPIEKEQEKFTKQYLRNNPEMKDVVNSDKEIKDFFSNSNFEDVKAKININRDKAVHQAADKYYGKNGIFMRDPEYVGIQHKFAELVGEGKMTEDVAKNQMQQEIKNNPNLKKIDQLYQFELVRAQEQSQREYENYIVAGLKGKGSNLSVYDDGSLGVKGLSKNQFKKKIKEYEEGVTGVAQKMGAESNDAWKRQANAKATGRGAFFGSLESSTNSLMSGMTKMFFNKTGWGGDRVRNFESHEIAEPQVSQSDVAATWNWKGIESLVNPNFYLSGVGGMVPVIAGAALVGTATEGEGVPEYISWLSGAGLFTAQSAVSTYNNLLGSKDKDGNTLTEADASHYAAKQAGEDFLPNLAMMMVTSGALLKAKSIVKPSIGKAIAGGVGGAVAAQPFFTWQGYNEYSTMLEAQGKTPEFSDYLQSKDFRDNLVNGIVLGGALSLLHTPGHYIKSMNDWHTLVHTSEGEFKNLTPQNYALSQEMAGGGNHLRDALKLKIFNTDPAKLDEQGKRELADAKNQLIYSTNLDRNIRQGNLDRTNINDLYQAHNLALADQHDYFADQAAKDGNKNLSDIYKNKAKGYREQADASANDQAKFHYLVTDEGHPIFMSDNSFKVLDKDGKIAQWMKDGTIKDVVKSDDVEFSNKYRDLVKPEEGEKEEPHVEQAADLIEANKEKLGAYYFVAKSNPEEFLQNVADQAFGYTRQDGERVKSDLPDAEKVAREQYGGALVDLAKKLYPEVEQPKSRKQKRQRLDRKKRSQKKKSLPGSTSPISGTTISLRLTSLRPKKKKSSPRWTTPERIK